MICHFIDTIWTNWSCIPGERAISGSQIKLAVQVMWRQNNMAAHAHDLSLFLFFIFKEVNNSFAFSGSVNIQTQTLFWVKNL